MIILLLCNLGDPLDAALLDLLKNLVHSLSLKKKELRGNACAWKPDGAAPGQGDTQRCVQLQCVDCRACTCPMSICMSIIIRMYGAAAPSSKFQKKEQPHGGNY